MIRKERILLVWWREALRDYPREPTQFQMQKAVEYYNLNNPNNRADIQDLEDALEALGDL